MIVNQFASSLDHLVGKLLELRRHMKAKCRCGLEVDHQIEPFRALYRQVDIVWRGADGMLHFVDRKKNIIRRSGENIAAAEVEAVLLTHPDVQQAAVMAVKDELREEEVFACVVLKRKVPDREAAMALFQHCYERLAYYKAPGWIHVVDTLPTTGTQKIRKHSIYPGTFDPRSVAAVVDLRALKKRDQA